MESSGTTTSPGRSTFGRDLLVVLGVTAVLGSVSLIYPFGRDQGIFAYTADLVLHGKVLYHDIYTGILPMPILVNAVALALFGHSMTSIRILDLLWTMATAGFLFALVLKAFRRRGWAMAAAVLYAFLYYQFDFWHTAQGDGFMNLPLTVAFLLALVASDRVSGPWAARLYWAGAGVLLGLAVLFKYTMLPLGLGLLALALFSREYRARKLNWDGAVMLAIGFSLVIAFFAAALAKAGELGNFVAGQVRGTLGYSRVNSSQGNAFALLVDMVRSYVVNPNFGAGALLGLFGLVVSIRQFIQGGPERKGLILCWMWLAAALLSVYVQGKFFSYHYLPALPALAVLGALALLTLLGPIRESLRQDWLRKAFVVAAGVVLLACTVYPLRFRDLAAVTTRQDGVLAYWGSSNFQSGGFTLGEQMAVADYLDNNTKPSDRVLIWGMDPLIYFLSERRNATRFMFDHPLAADWALPELRAELMDSLRNDAPEVFITEHDDAMPWVMGHDLDSYQTLREFEELFSFVDENYDWETRVGRFDVLRRARRYEPLPSLPGGTAGLPADLQLALDRVADYDLSECRTIFWPTDVPARLPPGKSRELAGKLLSFRDLTHEMWSEDRELYEFLPAISVWIRGDNRPYVSSSPFSFQNDAENFITIQYRFTLADSTPDGRVLIYEAAERTGEENVRANR